MAGACKPAGATGKEAKYKIIGYKLYDPAENLFTGGVNTPSVGPFVGLYNRTGYDYASWQVASDFLDIEIDHKVNIWEYGFQTNFLRRLRIYDNTNGIKGALIGTTLNGVLNDWCMIYASLPPGRYRFEMDATDASNPYHAGVEWFLERADTTKVLVKTVNDEIYSTVNGRVAKIDVVNPAALTQADFENHGTTSLTPFITLYNTLTQNMNDGGVLGSGKLSRLVIDTTKYNIQKIEVI